MPQCEMPTKKIPRRALMFAAEFAPSMDAPQEENGQKVYPFKMVARTGGVAQHPWWGRCIHDFAGMIPAKPSVTVDYCHDPCDVIGYADSLQVVENALEMSGALISLQCMDRAEEVVLKRRAGVPYETSILTNWDGIVVEEISDGMVATVNGMEVEGPLTIFRQWQLWGVAVCPYGSDANTDVQFHAGVPGEIEVSLIERKAMSNGTPATVETQAVKTGKDYMAKFGKEKGALWFAEGKPWDECQAQFEADMAADSQAKDEQIAQLKGQLADMQAKYDSMCQENTTLKGENSAFKRGTDPVSGGIGGAAGSAGEIPKQFQHMGKGIGTFAASIKLPGAKAAT